MMKAFYGLTFFVIWFFVELVARFEGNSNSTSTSIISKSSSKESELTFVACDAQVDNFMLICRPENPGYYFVGFRVYTPSGMASDYIVKDLSTNPIANNIGIRRDDPSLSEIVDLTAPAANISLAAIPGDDEYFYYGPFPNGEDYNIVLECVSDPMIQIPVGSGTYSCIDNQLNVCDTTNANTNPPLPVYNIDFSTSIQDSFKVIARSRVEACSANNTPASNCVNGNNKRCFEFVITLGPDAVGLSAQYEGANAQEFYISGKTGTKQTICNMLLASNPSGANTSSICVPGDSSYIVLLCKAGNDESSVTVKQFVKPTINDSITIEDCNLSITANNALDPKWSSYDDNAGGVFHNVTGFSGIDSAILNFKYNDTFYGPITDCAGRNFHYVISARPNDTVCTGNVFLTDTAEITVYPTFIVNIIQTCNLEASTITLFADTASPATGCLFNFKWYNLSAPAW
jgi:hypothetical protein